MADTQGDAMLQQADNSRQLLSELQELTKRVQDGDREAIVPLRNWLASHREVWSQLGEQAQAALSGHYDVLAGDNPEMRAALRTRVEVIKDSLGYHAASPLEKLAIDRIAVAAMHVCLAEALESNADISDTAQAKYLEQRLARASRRFFTGCKQLALLRKLLPNETGRQLPDNTTNQSLAKV